MNKFRVKKVNFSYKFLFSRFATINFPQSKPRFQTEFIFHATQLNILRKTYHPPRKVVSLFQDLWQNLTPQDLPMK